MNHIEARDTLFIASGNPENRERPSSGMDASHRAGAPGFLKVLDGSKLVLPDYAGNNLFNTIGNLLVDPRAGLLFVDFSSGALLQLSGTTRIDWDSARVGQYEGARRLIEFELREFVWLEPQAS